MMATRPPPSPSSSTPSAIESSGSITSSSSTTSNGRPKIHRNSFPFIPRQLSQSFKAALPFPRLYSGPLFAAPSVSVSHTHIVSNSSSVGPLTPPLTIDSFPTPIPSDHHPTTNTTTNPSTTPIMDTHNKLRMVVIAQQKQQQQPWIRKPPFDVGDVVHDMYCCMFRITLDSKGTMGKRACIILSCRILTLTYAHNSGLVLSTYPIPKNDRVLSYGKSQHEVKKRENDSSLF